VQAVTAGSSLPLDGGISPIRWGTAQAQGDPGKFQATDLNVVLPGFFETMRVPLIAGRTFTEADNSPDRPLVVVDQKLAEKAFPNESAIGKRILTRIQTPEAVWVEIIGVVAHQRENTLTQEGREQIFFTDGYLNHGFVGRWAVRTNGDPSQYTGPIRAAIARKDSHLAIFEVQPMQVWVEKAQASTKFSLLLIGLFGGMAALLTAVGLYGVLSTVVRQRSAEIGVRMAVGAAPASIFNLIVGQGLRLTLIGVAVGIVAALGFTRGIRTLLVNVKPTDPVTFIGMAIFFLAIAAVASWLPARRAAGLAPVAALRDE
jgi:putative ABC transport system permease protein